MSELSRLVERCAAPAAVASVIARMGEADPGLAGRLEAHRPLVEALLAVVAASDSMARTCETHPTASLEVLAHLDHRTPLDEASDVGALQVWKQLELMRIAARDLVGLDSLEVVGASLAELGDEVLQAALRLAGGNGCGLAVIGMGKLGAAELNYASDVDLVFVAPDGARPSEGAPPDRVGLEEAAILARRVLEVAAHCYRVDVALRPEGRAGPLVRSLASYQAYWQRWVRPWELQALLKARHVAGDPDLGAKFVEAAAEAIWSRPWGVAELREAREMKARTEAALVRRGLSQGGSGQGGSGQGGSGQGGPGPGRVRPRRARPRRAGQAQPARA